MYQAVNAVGTDRLLWGSDLTMDTAWAKLRYLERMGLTAEELEKISFRNALEIFPDGCFGPD